MNPSLDLFTAIFITLFLTGFVFLAFRVPNPKGGRRISLNWENPRYGNSARSPEGVCQRLQEVLPREIPGGTWKLCEAEWTNKLGFSLMRTSRDGLYDKLGMDLDITLERTIEGGSHVKWQYKCFVPYEPTLRQIVIDTDKVINLVLNPASLLQTHIANQVKAVEPAEEAVPPHSVAQQQIPAPKPAHAVAPAPAPAPAPKADAPATVTTPPQNPPAPSQVSTCPKCGKPRDPSFHFCIYCSETF